MITHLLLELIRINFIHYQTWFKDNPSIYERFTNLETEPSSQESVKNINTGEELATVYIYDLDSVNKILESAATTKEWRSLTNIQRATAINRYN